MTINELKKRIGFLDGTELPFPAKNSLVNLYQQCIDQIELIKSIANSDLPDAAFYCKEYLTKIGEPHGQETSEAPETQTKT